MYRERLYKAYVHGRSKSLVQETVDSLKPRAPYLNRLIEKHFPKEKDAPIAELGKRDFVLESLQNNLSFSL
jgi:hypothetical protein